MTSHSSLFLGSFLSANPLRRQADGHTGAAGSRGACDIFLRDEAETRPSAHPHPRQDSHILGQEDEDNGSDVAINDQHLASSWAHKESPYQPLLARLACQGLGGDGEKACSVWSCAATPTVPSRLTLLLTPGSGTPTGSRPGRNASWLLLPASLFAIKQPAETFVRGGLQTEPFTQTSIGRHFHWAVIQERDKLLGPSVVDARQHFWGRLPGIAQSPLQERRETGFYLLGCRAFEGLSRRTQCAQSRKLSLCSGTYSACACLCLFQVSFVPAHSPGCDPKELVRWKMATRDDECYRRAIRTANFHVVQPPKCFSIISSRMSRSLNIRISP
jgi:hypothetical protein